MARPEGTLALIGHVISLRWQGLSRRGRVAVIAAVALTGAVGAHVAIGSACCAGSCATRRAELEAAATTAPVAAADTDSTDTGCADED